MADGTVKIDLLFPANKQKFHSDTEMVDDLLKRIGEGTGDALSEDFDANAEKMSDKASSTFQKVKDDFSDPIKQKLEGDDSNLSEKVANAKANLEKLPDETLTELKAEAEKAGITDFDSLLETLPEEEITELLAKAEKGEVINFDDLLASLPEETRTKLLASGSTKPITTFDELLAELPKETRTSLKAKAERGEINSFDELLAELPKEKRTELKAKAERGEIRSFDELLGTLPKRTITRLTADAEAHGINNFDKLLKRLPKKTVTELLAKAEKGEVINYEELLRKIPSKYVTSLELNDNASPGLHNIQNEAEETGNKFSHLKEIIAGSFLGNAISGAFSKITGSLGDLWHEAENASDAMQGFEATMQLAGFGEKKIKSVGKEVKKYADETVYDLKDVSSTTAQLGANGVKNFEQLTEAAGNLTAVSGGTKDDFKSITMVMTQTAGAGKLTTENWNQLTDAIPGASKKLQDAMKKNGAFTGDFRDAMADGQISAEEFNKAIMQLGMTDKAKEYAKGTAAFEGAFGNVQATVVNGMQAIIEAIGKKNITDAINSMAGVAEKGFGILVDMIDKVKSKSAILGLIGSRIADIAKIFGSEIWKQVKNVFSELGDTFGKLTGKSKDMKDPLAAISNALLDISEHKDAIKKVADALMILFAVKKAKQFLGVIGGIPKKFIDIGKHAIINAKFKYAKAKNAIKTFGSIIKTSAKGVKSAVKWTARIATKGAKLAMKGLVTTAKATGKGLKAAFSFLKANPFVLLASAIAAVIVGFVELYKHNKKFRKFVDGIVKSAKKIFKGVTKWFGQMFKGAVKHVKNLWNSTKKHFSNGWSAVKKGAKNGKKAITDHFNSMKKSAVKHAKNMWSSTKDHFSNGWSNVKKLSSKGKAAISDHFKNMKKRTVETAKEMWKSAKRTFKDGAKYNQDRTKLMKDVLHGHWGNISKDTKNLAKDMKKGVQDIFKGMYDTLNKWTGGRLGDMVKKFKDKFGSLKDIVDGAKDNVKHSFIGLVRGVLKPFNKMLKGLKKGINWVLSKVGASKIKADWSISLPSYAHGTGGIMSDQLALVNDSKSSNYREMYATPDGQIGQFPAQRNIIVPLRKGTEILDGNKSATLAKTLGVRAYAGGKVGNFFSNMWDKGKDLLDDAENIIAHPIKFMENVFSKHLGKLTSKIELPKQIITHFPKTIANAAKDWIKTLFENEGGSFDGKMGAHGVYAYLWNIAKKAMKKFGMKFTSGYRPGDKYYHGKHQAVDIAYDAGSNGSRKYFNPANWVFEHFPNQIGYVITQGKIRTRGKFNHLGSKANGWSTWMDHDHYDHLHINGMWGPGDVGAGGGKVQGSHKSLLKRAGFKEGEIAAANWLVQKESGWNPHAVNSGSGAYGLAQALNKPGSMWKGSPLQQLKWMSNYIHSRYGSANAAKSFHLSHNWYENGGFSNQEQLAHISEGNKLEGITPLSAEKSDRGYMMLGKQAAYMATRDSLKASDSVDSNYLNRVEQDLSRTITLLNRIDITGKANVKATYNTAFTKDQMYSQQAKDQQIFDMQTIGGTI